MKNKGIPYFYLQIIAITASYDIISSFPDFRQKGFCTESYNDAFNSSNIFIHAKAKQITYPLHWGGFSLKCAFNGKEFYRVNNADIAVHDTVYMMMNHGNYYESYIDSADPVESLSINFSPAFVRQTIAGMKENDPFLTDHTGSEINRFEFHEQLTPYDPVTFSLVSRLRKLSARFYSSLPAVEETYILLLENIVRQQYTMQQRIQQVNAIKLSTKKELYKRLFLAKDHIDSCFTRDISIAELSAICLLNQTYFLRHFKAQFKLTPRQYIISKRMHAAQQMLCTQKNISISEICSLCGYNDLASFSRLFKAYYGLSPVNYRQVNV